MRHDTTADKREAPGSHALPGPGTNSGRLSGQAFPAIIIIDAHWQPRDAGLPNQVYAS